MEPEQTLTDRLEGCWEPAAPWGGWRRSYQRWYRQRGCPGMARAWGLCSHHDQQREGARQARRSAQAR